MVTAFYITDVNYCLCPLVRDSAAHAGMSTDEVMSSDDNSNRPTYCMKLLFATLHLVARKSLSNNDSAICGERKSITMACKLAKFPQQNCIVQNQFRGPGNRHHVPRRLFKHSAGHTVEALYFCEQLITSEQWPLHEHKHCLHW